jgi:HTH-type transcriptional regulator, sugar sensing transcriptional regulator
MEYSLQLGKLVELGFSEREAKVYLALLHQRSATSADLQRSSGIPQTKVYEIIRRLVQQGYCRERKVGHKRTFEVIDPQSALAFPIQKLETLVQDAQLLKEELTTIYASAKEVIEPLEYLEILHGNETIHHHYCQLVRNAQNEILGFGRPPYACDTSDKVSEQDVEMKALIQRGGVSRWIYQTEGMDPDWPVNTLTDLANHGVLIRMTPRLPLKMMVFDNREVLVAHEDPYALPGDLTMVIIKQSTIANAYRALFDFFWAQASEMQTQRRYQKASEA